MTTPVSPRAQRDILPAEADQPGDAPTGLDRHPQPCPVAPTGPWLLIWRRHERVDLGAGQTGDGRAVITLTRDGQDAWDHATMARRLPHRIVETRVTRRQAHLAATGAGTALVCQIRQKRADHRCLQSGQRPG